MFKDLFSLLKTKRSKESELSPEEIIRSQYRINKIIRVDQSVYYEVSKLGSGRPPRPFIKIEDAREYIEECVAKSVIRIEEVK